MTDFKDFENHEGRVDWHAYRKQKVKIGEECSECGKLIHIEGIDTPGHPEMCQDCNDMVADKGEVTHAALIRCPHCSARMKESREWLSEGEHGVICQECEFEFEITTEVTYIFTSPELLEPEPGGE